MKNEDRVISIVAALLLIPLAFLAVRYYHVYGARGLSIYLGGISTLALYSILYRENPIYRFAEHIFLGLSAGWAVVTVWTDVLSSNWYDPVMHDGLWLWLWVIPLAVMAYFIFNRKHGWISRIPLLLLIGFGTGQMFQGYSSQYFPQIRDSFKSLRPTMMSLQNTAPGPNTLSISGAINNIIFLVVLLAVLTYFLFSFEQKNKGVRNFAQLGRWFMMIGFGAIFGSTIMTRFALLVDRMYFVLVEWLHVARPT